MSTLQPMTLNIKKLFAFCGTTCSATQTHCPTHTGDKVHKPTKPHITNQLTGNLIEGFWKTILPSGWEGTTGSSRPSDPSSLGPQTGEGPRRANRKHTALTLGPPPNRHGKGRNTQTTTSKHIQSASSVPCNAFVTCGTTDIVQLERRVIESQPAQQGYVPLRGCQDIKNGVLQVKICSCDSGFEAQPLKEAKT